MKSLYLGIAGGLTAIAGGILVWKYRDNLRPAVIRIVVNNAKTSVVDTARTAYGSVARAADNAVHTERDAQQS